MSGEIKPQTVIETLRDALLEREELVGIQIIDVIASAKPTTTQAPSVSS